MEEVEIPKATVLECTGNKILDGRTLRCMVRHAHGIAWLPSQSWDAGEDVMLNFQVDDVDAEYRRLTGAGLTAAMPLEDHPRGDRGFSVIDPLSNNVYIHSDRDPSPEFKQYYVG